MANDNSKKPLALALGTFDGLHKGHAAVIEAAVSLRAKGFDPFVLLFNKHPLEVLKGKAPAELMTPELRVKELDRLGAKSIVLDFERIKDLSAREFVEGILVKQLNVRALSCGYDYHFGHHAQGTPETLQELCDENGLELHVSPAVLYKGEAISSTRIRRAIEEGDLKSANAMLGRDFSFDFEVSHGKKLGRTIGCPTINQTFSENFVRPKQGVYFSHALVEGQKRPALTSIGTRPTFEGKSERSETFILDFCGDLYGKRIEVSLTEYLREERKFKDIEELSRQIQQDILEAKKYFSVL
ncbi:MAG TPA: bifunctional riboflavin kinase/FAD synthetase [Clostridiales bacterium]|nr:bifunctional riboflavin kinase/FAD synthetase [Clostridiales bacterium]